MTGLTSTGEYLLNMQQWSSQCLSRVREGVSRESHKLQSLVRFQDPQPVSTQRWQSGPMQGIANP